MLNKFKNLNLPPQDVVDATNEVFREVISYLNTKELEQTKRANITANRDVAIEAIRSQREVILESLRYMFEERAQVIQKQFQALDYALETGNVALADTAMKSMVNVIQSSPFKNIQEMQNAMGAKDFVVRLE